MDRVSHIVINSNKWFSAVSDYSLQLTNYLSTSEGKSNVLFCGHESSPIRSHLEKSGLSFSLLPLLPSGLFGFFRSWKTLTHLLETSANKDATVWTFEGREHSLCAIHRIFHRSLWDEKALVRVRGQAADVRGHRIIKWLYLKATDKVIFAAAAIARKFPFYVGATHAKVQLYCADNSVENVPLSQWRLAPEVPEINFAHPTFLVVGRFDPVKGHFALVEAFSKVSLPKNFDCAQLVILGNSQNVSANEIYNHARKFFPSGMQLGSRSFVTSNDKTLRVFIVDERIENMAKLMASAHFGVIPSLGSEVICRVAVEFLQQGTPLLASYVGALSEVLAATPSRLFVPADVREMAASMEWALDVISDTSRYQDFRAKSQQAGLSRFSLSRFSDIVTWVKSK